MQKHTQNTTPNLNKLLKNQTTKRDKLRTKNTDPEMVSSNHQDRDKRLKRRSEAFKKGSFKPGLLTLTDALNGSYDTIEAKNKHL